jgi:hypothetical protein
VADQLCTPSDLASLLQQDLDASTALLLVECATAVVQSAAGGQRIVRVVDDVAELTGTTDSWLDLPQVPVTAVSAVTLDGGALSAGVPGSGGTTYRRKGDRLWRGDGWQQFCNEPSDVVVTFTHGYPPGDQGLQRARAAALMLAAGPYDNPAGAASVRIDDYAATYERMSARMEESPRLKAALRKQYGRRGGLVRIG